MKVLKKNQLAILVIALMLVTAGYLNYTANYDNSNNTIASTEVNTTNMAEVGDATLVNSGDIVSGENNTTETTNNIADNTTNNVNNDANTTQTNAQSEDEYFVKSRLERDTMYSQMIDTYTKILENNSISEEQKGISRQEISNINNTKNAIMISENLIKTKDIKNCVIFVNDKSISVIVKEDELPQDKVAQIQNIVSREMKSEIENIHIINKK